MRRLRTSVQMIFQDPISSLNPRRKVSDIVAEPLDIWGVGTKQDRHKRATEVLEDVGIDPRSPPIGGRISSRVASASASPSRGHSCSTRSSYLRRAGVGARRQRAGASAEPARRPEGALRPHDDLHRPRPRRREEHQRPHLRDVPRQALRGGLGRRAVPRAGAPLHRPRCSSRSPFPTPRFDPIPTVGSAASSLADVPAVGLPVPHALPGRAGALHRRRAGAPRHWQRSLHRLSLSDRAPRGTGSRRPWRPADRRPWSKPTRSRTRLALRTATRTDTRRGHRRVHRAGSRRRHLRGDRRSGGRVPGPRLQLLRRSQRAPRSALPTQRRGATAAVRRRGSSTPTANVRPSPRRC